MHRVSSQASSMATAYAAPRGQESGSGPSPPVKCLFNLVGAPSEDGGLQHLLVEAPSLPQALCTASWSPLCPSDPFPCRTVGQYHREGSCPHSDHPTSAQPEQPTAVLVVQASPCWHHSTLPPLIRGPAHWSGLARDLFVSFPCSTPVQSLRDPGWCTDLGPQRPSLRA